MFSKKLRALLMLFAIFFTVAIVYLPGFSKYQELKRREIEITKETGRLREVRLQLAREEKLLESDPDYLERVARENLGRVRPGEVVYKILPAEKKKRMKEDAGHNGSAVSPST